MIKKGQTLISEPFMEGGSFHQSVIVLCDVHKDGVVGFIVNKSIEMNINDLIADFPDFESEILYGGPVQPDTIHYIHQYGDILPDSHKVKDDIYWGGDFEVLKKLISTSVIKTDKIKFFIGYSGWSAGQLEEELAESTWMKSDLEIDYLFKEPNGNMWQNILKSAGDTYSVLSEIPKSFNPN